MFITGDKVILVNDKWPNYIAMYDSVPVKNKTYTVRDVRLGRSQLKNPENQEDDCEITITLNECKNGPDPYCTAGIVELGFRADRFRKIDEIKEKKQKKETLKQGELL